MTDADPLPRYKANLQGEVDGAAIYTALAESEKDPRLAEVFRKLAAVEQAHGAFWQRRIGAKAGRDLPAPSIRARILAWLARRFGPAFVVPALAATETATARITTANPRRAPAGFRPRNVRTPG
jgi:rubrerythrin